MVPGAAHRAAAIGGVQHAPQFQFHLFHVGQGRLDAFAEQRAVGVAGRVERAQIADRVPDVALGVRIVLELPLQLARSCSASR